MDRRNAPRIRFAKKPGFTVKLILKRFLLIDKEILGILRDLSEGGASLFVQDDYRKYISSANVGQAVRLISESSGISFRLEKKGKIYRISESNKQISIIVIFDKKAAS
ncbi:MAG: hypothetical protein A2W19_09115 [Spirochaetes bacterium RBG_16_49_21]|nr:MAG: hypothetical protein A2W19_09115 [Spirochaetes bacterium RBG_16_49_21]